MDNSKEGGQITFLWFPSNVAARERRIEKQLRMSEMEVKSAIWGKKESHGARGGAEKGKTGIFIFIKYNMRNNLRQSGIHEFTLKSHE